MENKYALTLVELSQERMNWDELYHAMLPRIFNYFLYRIGNEQEAEDLSSILFERVWRNKGRYRSDLASFQTWMYGVAHNVFREYLRDRRKRQDLERRLHAETHDNDVLDRGKVERSLLLAHLIMELPDVDQELVALKYGAGLNNREIAKLTHLSESNVGTRLFRTITLLREQLEVKNGR